MYIKTVSYIVKYAYIYLNNLTEDIELLYPARFGRNLVLTPHTYIMKAAAVFTDSLYLNAQGNPDAVFVIKRFQSHHGLYC